MHTLLTLFLVILALAGGGAAGVFLRKKLVEDNQQNLALQGRQIIENAIGEAEQIKKSANLHAQEEALRLKNEADREIKENWKEVKEEQRRINRRSDELDREIAVLEERQAALEKRQDSLTEREAVVAAQNKELDEVLKIF